MVIREEDCRQYQSPEVGFYSPSEYERAEENVRRTTQNTQCAGAGGRRKQRMNCTRVDALCHSVLGVAWIPEVTLVNEKM